MIKAYQGSISKITAAHCRFYPSCSNYAISVVKTQPLHKALALIVWRMLRCQPLHKGGIDEPPQPTISEG